MSSIHLYFVHALSPLHAGTGQGVGVIDMPIAREKATDLPYLPGSSLKGPLRDACNMSAQHGNDQSRAGKGDSPKCKQVFGEADDSSSGTSRASAVQFSDARLLLLPIRSLYGTFAWVTSPYILNRFARDCHDLGLPDVPAPVPQPKSVEQCYVGEQPAIANNNKVYLEDLDLEKTDGDSAKAWTTWLQPRLFSDSHQNAEHWRTMLAERLCIAHDDVFSFLLQTATEITARIRLKADTKTVAEGALWYEESLPAESVLTGLALITPRNNGLTDSGIFKMLTELAGTSMQLGGKATVGRGLCRVQFVEESGK